MILAQKHNVCDFIVEEEAFEGVKRIAEKVAADVELVCGLKPEIRGNAPAQADACVIAATLGRSSLCEALAAAGKIDVTAVEGKREVYSRTLVANPFPGVKEALVILGSDKLGTIYGLFSLSEAIGVTAMVEFGDAVPAHKDELVLDKSIEMVSREPSVKYRGFFINDEWPCFGNWAVNHFGGINAAMYDHVFEFLLRMKGNYMWPAMWASSFPVDGPGSLNEELADLYGITIAYSHHEPCLRASEEWDQVRGEGTRYGNEWNFYTNKEGLTNYWADSLKRSGKYKHQITIGMRGERDSSMLGPDATLKDNIDLLKDVITTQRKLIGTYVNEDVDSVPQLLALYKEVEAYFYGDENTRGLKEWKELENVVFMLCEDNFGHMRTLPTEEIRGHKGGFGMYYHFDYHGGPVSYEWMPSTTMALTWEQMTQAYDYGIRDVWIVNVGDLKGNEVALQYFLTLAYDFETWGSSAPGSWQKYIREWAASIFPNAGKETQEKLANLYVDFVEINAMRRPECLSSNTYHPCNYHEADRMLSRALELQKNCEEVYRSLSEEERIGCYSMIYYPLMASMNLLKMQLYAGKNAFYASQGRKVANRYGELMHRCILEDRRWSEEFGAFRDGKWKGMELEQHVGFTKWNDDGWRYPLQMVVEPVTKPRMSVSRADDAFLAVKNYGAPMCIRIPDFLSEGVEFVELEISNDGVGSLHYQIRPETGEMPEWLHLSSMEGDVEELVKVSVCCDRTALKAKPEEVRLLVSDGDTTVAVEIKARKTECDSLPAGTHMPINGVVIMRAENWCDKKDVKGAAFTYLRRHGRSRGAMKVLPSTADFTEKTEAPKLTYSFFAEEAGEYMVELWTSPVNPSENKRPLTALVSNGQGQEKLFEILSSEYAPGEFRDRIWSEGVLNQIHKTVGTLPFEQGVQNITLQAVEPGLVLEKILIYQTKNKPKASYLGPLESFQSE